MIITLCGPNTYEIQRALRAVEAKFVASHSLQAVERLDGSDLTPSSLREQVSALSLFAPKRLVIVKGASGNKEVFAALEEVIPNVTDDVTLVIVDGVLDKRTKTYKVLKAKTDFHDFEMPSEGHLATWAGKYVAERGGTITSATARELVAEVGTDQWQLAGELDKLLAFDPHITIENVRQMVVPTLQTSAFALLDAALAGRGADARRLLRELRVHSDAYELFGLLVWQVTTLALVAAAPKMSSSELAKATGLKPFVLQKSAQLATKLGFAKVQRIVDLLAAVDVQLKSSGVEPWMLLEQVIGKIA